MGIGKLFHRDRTDGPQQSKSRSRATSVGANDASFQTARYESMPDAGLPQTGTYPIKGNNSNAAMTGQKSPFRHSMDPRSGQSARPGTSPHPITTTTGPTTTTTTTTTFMPPRIPTPKTGNNFQFFDQDQQRIPDRNHSPDNRRILQDSGLEQNFSGLKLGNDAGIATPPPASYYPGSGSGSSRLDPRVDSAPRNDAGVGKVNDGDQQKASPFYGRQRPEQQEQYSPSYGHQRPDQGYGSATGGPTAYRPASGDYSQGYDQAPRSSKGNRRASGDYSQAYNPTSWSPTDNPRTSGDLNGGYDPAFRGPAAGPRSSGGFNDIDGGKTRRRASITRKQVGANSHIPAPAKNLSSPSSPSNPRQSSDQASPLVPQHDQYSTQQPTNQYSRATPHNRLPAQEQPPPPVPSHDDYPRQQQDYNDPRSVPQQRMPTQESRPQFAKHPSAVPPGLNYSRGNTSHDDSSSPSRAPPLFPRAHNSPGGNAPHMTAQDIVHRAKTNTKDTDVVETIAPAIVQEKVIEKVHHKREEVVTREIHTHDVFHRILPIIDVEVLPPRHFLPVEGGGLVEIGADEVPGRAKNWVIAETASKIPSDQPAPKGASRFTAREFPGREGDTVTYITPEGIQRTEETWIHPPELETGAKNTGQTWPMVFGREEGKEPRIRTQGHSSGKEGNRRVKRRSMSDAMPGAYPMAS